MPRTKVQEVLKRILISGGLLNEIPFIKFETIYVYLHRNKIQGSRTMTTINFVFYAQLSQLHQRWSQHIRRTSSHLVQPLGKTRSFRNNSFFL